MVEERAKAIMLKAKKQVFTGNLGNNLTTFKGDGVDFAEIREYNSGDDVRKINWKATAKSGSLKLNEFNEERELHIVVVAMLSGGLNFGTKRLKQDVVAEMVALLGVSAISSGDRLEMLLFSNKIERHFRATKRVGAVEEAVVEIMSKDLIKKEADYEALTTYLTKLKRGAIVIVMGDFYEDIDLSTLIKHQLYYIRVRDHFEEEPNLSGEVELIEPSSLASLKANVSGSMLKEYSRVLSAHDSRVDEHFLEYGIRGGTLYTNDDLYLRAVQILK